MKKFTLITCLAFLFCGFHSVKAQDPTAGAPVPTYLADDVISFYSGNQTYPQVTDLSTLPWGQTATFDYAEAGGDGGECIVVNNLGWMPIGLAKRQPGVLNMQYCHVDIYCNEETDFQVGFQGYGDGGSETYFPAIKYTTLGQWYGIDYPLNLMTEQGFNLGLTNVLRIGGGAGKTYASKIYIGNLFVFNGEPTNLWTPSAINSAQNDKKLVIYPTVVSESFTINSESAVKSVEMYSSVGQRVVSLKGSNNEVNVSGLNAGVYIVTVTLEDGTKSTEKLIKK